MSACAAALTLTEPPEGYIGYQFKNVAIAFIVMETFFVGLRYYSRYLAGTKVGADDILMPLALLSNYGLCGVSIAMVVKAGVGRHTLWLCMMNPSALILYAKLQIPFTILQALAIAFAKVAILCLFLRIFIKPVYRYATYVLIFIQVGTLISITVVTCLVCTPLAYLWEPQLHPEGKCIDINSFWRWGSFPQLVTDVGILVLPLPALWQLQLSTRDKLGVIVTFCTGSIGLVTSIIRFVFFWKIDSQTDGAWVATRLGCASIAEAGVYLIAACLPTYRSLFRSARSRATTSVDKRGYYSGSGSKDTELKSFTKLEKGFHAMSHDDGRVTVSAAYKNQGHSDEELMAAPGPMDIKVQRNFYVSSS